MQIGDRFLHAFLRNLVRAHPTSGTLHEIREVEKILAERRLRLGELRGPNDLLALEIDEL